MREALDTELGRQYRAYCETRSDINEHLPTFVQIALDLDAQKIIELGVRDGISTCAWLYALEQTGGHLWSVDLTNNHGPEPGWTFVVGNDLDPRVLELLPTDVDIVFIDTSHFYEHTRDELSAYLPKVRPGGRIVLHDSDLERPENSSSEPPFPVLKAATEFCKAHHFCWTEWQNNNGLLSIQIPEGT